MTDRLRSTSRVVAGAWASPSPLASRSTCSAAPAHLGLLRAPPALAARRALLRQPPGVPQRASQHEFDLTVQAPQVVVCPTLQGVEEIRIHAQQEGPALRHQTAPFPRVSRRRSRVIGYW